MRSWSSSSPTSGHPVRPTLPEPGAVVLDTDVASLIIKGRGQPLAPQLAGRTWCVSLVTAGELVKWAELQGWGQRKWTALADWLGPRRGAAVLGGCRLHLGPAGSRGQATGEA